MNGGPFEDIVVVDGEVYQLVPHKRRLARTLRRDMKRAAIEL